MNQHSRLGRASLLERAADFYDFDAELRMPAQRPPLAPASPAVRAPEALELVPPPVPKAELEVVPEPAIAPAVPAAEGERPQRLQKSEAPRKPAARRPRSAGVAVVDRDRLEALGFIVPEAPVTGLAEEFRIIKRQLLLGISGNTGVPEEKRQTLLVCSAQPDDGKTFCALNLALSLASEEERDVLLVDGDFTKPEILSLLGIEPSPGLVDAIADPSLAIEELVIRTDIKGLSVLPAGSQSNSVTELLASNRTRLLLDELCAADPHRIVLFDSPPALAASPAPVLAALVGQVVMVVRADQTTEADLREAVALLSGCEHLSLMLNGAAFAATGRRFGSYYGYGQ